MVFIQEKIYIKDGAHVINLDEHESIGTLWIDLDVSNNNVTYFDRFRVEHITKEVKKFIGNKIIITNIYRTSIRFDNVWTLLYWIYWFYVKG